MKGFIICYNENHEEIYKTSLIKLPLKEEFIIKKSRELYNEEEPCIIYRTAIINKTGLELLKKIEKSNKSNIKFNLKELDDFIGNFIYLPPGTKYIKFI